MTYVIGQACVDVKDLGCVEVCPVDCIYEGVRTLYIHPSECIDCGACESVCPVEAITFSEDAEGEDRCFVGFAEEVLRPAAHEWDEREEFPFEIVQQAAEIGLYGWEFMMNAMADQTGLTLPVASAGLSEEEGAGLPSGRSCLAASRQPRHNPRPPPLRPRSHARHLCTQ